MRFLRCLRNSILMLGLLLPAGCASCDISGSRVSYDTEGPQTVIADAPHDASAADPSGDVTDR